MMQKEDAFLRSIFEEVQSIAIVGTSPRPERASNDVMKYLMDQGIQVFPVNPGHAGKAFFGRPVFASLADLPEPVDLVDIFQNAEAALATMRLCLEMPTQPKVVWMQLGISHDEAPSLIGNTDVKLVMDRCIKTEHRRLVSHKP